MKLDRLARALAPYAGVLTVSTCGAPPDCEENGDQKTVTVQASTTGSVAVTSSRDGRIDAALVRGGDPVAPAWRCEATLFASGHRATADTSNTVPLAGSAQVSCSIGDGRITTRVLSFTVPLADVRTLATASRLPVSIDVNVQATTAPETSCNAKLDAAVDVEVTGAAGAAAAGPAYVTPDFTRDLRLVVHLTGATTPVTPDRPCAMRLDGTATIDAHLEASSFREGDTPTCL